MSDRLSRKEIKRDEFAEAVQRGTEALQRNWTVLAAAGAAILLLVLGFIGYRAYAANRAAKAGQALDRALEIYSAPVDAAAAQPDDPEEPTFASEKARSAKARELFEEVSESYGGSAAGAIAHAYLGTLAAEEGQAEEARRHWQAYLDREPRGLMATNVRLSMMRLDLEQGQGEAVATRLEEMLASADQEMPEDVLLYQLASARETLGLGGEALSAYQRLVDDHPSSPYTQVARQRVAALSTGETAPIAF